MLFDPDIPIIRDDASFPLIDGLAFQETES